MSSNELKKVGLKATLPRMKVLQMLESQAGEHFSAESLRSKLESEGNGIALATVYRVLSQFEDAGIVVRHQFDNDHAVYELNQGEHHDHLVCVQCGKVVEFVDETIEQKQREIAKREGFEMTDHQLCIYGVCITCKNK